MITYQLNGAPMSRPDARRFCTTLRDVANHEPRNDGAEPGAPAALEEAIARFFGEARRLGVPKLPAVQE